MFAMNALLAGAAAGGSLTESFSLSYITSVSETSPGTTTDYGTLSLGVDVSGDDKRYTVVCVTGIFGPPTTASLTVAATSASAVSDGVTDAIKIQSSKGGAWIFIVDTSGLGTTGNITATFDVSPGQSGLSVFRLINPSSITATDVVTYTEVSGGLVTLDATISTGGAAVACTQSQNGGSATWAGLTERYDSDLATNEYFSSASGGSSGSPASISMTSSDTSPTSLFGVCASFAPHPSAP